jgi:lysophospholipid acyltransferase (LPLAT)-like uncharacterized protein
MASSIESIKALLPQIWDIFAHRGYNAGVLFFTHLHGDDMARGKKILGAALTRGSTPDGFINVPVSRATREGLHVLKEAMDVASQADVIEKLVAIGMAISQASQQ